MIPISNSDAALIRDLLERGNKFYSNHATATRHINDGRRMAVMAGKLRKKINGTRRGVQYCEPSARKNPRETSQPVSRGIAA